ncbi:MAG TPA: hypothetical protein VGQ39_13955, partial [Pyrinomonadaceae bacterium]|nr:hypothetical protein [Pyrinomonadaceae bacterium]HEV8369053.1 hypothetical protein [Pyrinomonadaceae bacterium]
RWSFVVLRAAKAQSTDTADVETYAPFASSLAALSRSPPSLSAAAVWRHYLRQEPDAVTLQVRICGGGG